MGETTNNAVGQAGVDSYTIALTSTPTANVVVTLTPTVATAINSTRHHLHLQRHDTHLYDNKLEYPQTVRGNNDTTGEGPHWGRVVHTVATAGGYTAGMPIPLVTTHIADDDDTIILRHTGTETRVMEGDFTDTITVALHAHESECGR